MQYDRVSLGMEIRLNAHGAYHHEYHVVWIPKYRKKILKGEIKACVEEHIFDIQRYHPEIEIERHSIQADHVRLIIIIPPKYSVSRIVGRIKANTSRELRQGLEQVRKIYRGNEFWSPGFFSSTVGINEETIKRYVEFQEKLDKGQLQMNFDFQVPRA
jgi:putative transposase